MTPWQRIDEELTSRKKNWKWLGGQLGINPSAVGNWTSRGVPAKHYASIAQILGKSTDWVVDGQPVKTHELKETKQSYGWPFALVSQARYEALSPEAQGAAQMRMMDEVVAQEAAALKANGTFN